MRLFKLKTLDHRREELAEGRNQGISFSLLGKVNRETFEELHALSPCKDYLQDVIYTETTKDPIKACGLKYEYSGKLYKNRKYTFLSVDNLNKTTVVPDNTLFLKQLPNCLAFVNAVEKKMGLRKSRIYNTDKGSRRIIKLDSYWIKYPYLISLYGLLFRDGVKYKGQDIDEYVSKEINAYGYLKKSWHKVKYLMENEPPPQIHKNSNKVHSMGIANFNDGFTNK